VGGRPVSSLQQLLSRLDDFQVGDTTTLTLWRDGVVQTVEVRLRD